MQKRNNLAIQEERVRVILKIVISLFILLISFITLIYFFSDKTTPIPPNTVIEIIDGDTFKIASGQTVRLLCIDTPEKGSPGYEEAKSFLEERILYSAVDLQSEGQDTDLYGRLLRYVYLNGDLINKEIILNNHSKLYIFRDDSSKCKKNIVI